jgi:hypothetical protein
LKTKLEHQIVIEERVVEENSENQNVVVRVVEENLENQNVVVRVVEEN